MSIAGQFEVDAYPDGWNYHRPSDQDMIKAGGCVLGSSNDGQSDLSFSPTDEWLFPDGSRLVVAYSYCEEPNTDPDCINAKRVTPDDPNPNPNPFKVPFHEMTLKQALMQGQSVSAEEADELIAGAREDVADGMDPEEVLYDLGLEPDYVFDLLGW